MKLWSGLVFLVALASGVTAEIITTRDGRSFTNAEVIRWDAASVTLKYSGGIERVRLATLTAEIQKQFGFDVEKANQLVKDERATATAVRAREIEQKEYLRDVGSKLIVGGKLVDAEKVLMKNLSVYIRSRRPDGTEVELTSVTPAEYTAVSSRTDRLAHIGGRVGGASPSMPTMLKTGGGQRVRTGEMAILLDYRGSASPGELVSLQLVETDSTDDGWRAFYVVSDDFTFEQWRRSKR